ncbi:patatin-like phospholipase family protein [Allorhizocola rhizosphaerae]|uniref:patatin-like phospholipase family protein n=1 Tax=Allorhizocola rhizosphaerae TaxID=1872709 RepID=UPI000E3E8216|nr:patatin-like phospholipase family protein [Allorhizocola rhizosphaerae]
MTGSRALVLGGGGVTGIAWEFGVLAGLTEVGVDVTGADLVVGTSAGAVVGAVIASGAPVRDRYEAQLAPAHDELAARLGPGLLARYAWALAISRSPQRFGARMGALALAAKTVPAQARREVIASRLPVGDWSDRALKVTAVDASTGKFVVFDRDSGVPLVDAVAASCAVPGVWPPAEINGRRYIDGGMRSAANADLAAGASSVVILAPVVRGGGVLQPPQRQAEALRARGARVVLVHPDPAALRAIGRNVLDPARRRPAAEAGFTQAATVSDAVAEVWH